MTPGICVLRAKAIELLFVHIYNSPPKTEWRQLNLLPAIMRFLQNADGSFSRVTAILKGILNAKANGIEFKTRLDGRGRKTLIIDNDYCDKIVYHAITSGQSIQSSAHMVNVVREGRGEQSVSWSALHRFVSNSDIIQTQRRHTKKTEKMTKTLQVLSQLAKGKGRAISGVDLAGLDALYLHDIVWWDKKYPHLKD
jgi:hypothetical protein